ncbi:MAG: AarF/UbiB family protein, partial [Bacteroidia bacterium]
IADKVKTIDGLFFPKFYPKLSSKRIITMDWLDGMHLGDFLKSNPSQEAKNKAGQLLWDFYNFQVNHLQQVHADPHPGNFLFTNKGEVGVLDFGCVKEFSYDFYRSFFSLLSHDVLNDEEKVMQKFKELKLIYDDDSNKERDFFLENIRNSVGLIAKPFKYDEFDFGDKSYIKEIYEYGEKMSKAPEIRKTKKARGPKDALFINRTLFGMYNMLAELEAKVKVNWDFKI